MKLAAWRKYNFILNDCFKVAWRCCVQTSATIVALLLLFFGQIRAQSGLQYFAGLSSSLVNHSNATQNQNDNANKGLLGLTVTCPPDSMVCIGIATLYNKVGTSWDAKATSDCSGTISILYSTDINVNPSSGATLNGAAFSAGTHTITWTISDGCSAIQTCIQTITVNNSSSYPSLIAGTFASNNLTECAGYHPVLTLSGMSGGLAPYNYQWRLNGSAVSGATSTTFDVGQLLTPGNYVIDAIVTDGCGSTATTLSKAITIVADPSVSLSGGGTVCQNQSVSLSATVTDGTGTMQYQWQSASASSGPWTNVGTITPSSTYAPVTTISGTTYYRVILNPNVASCGNATSNAISVTVDVLPTLFDVTGGGEYCFGGTGRPIGLNSSQTGIKYQLQVNGANVGLPVDGTGSAISFGNQTIAGTYTVVATNTTTLCSANMNGSVTVTINPLPTVALTSKTNVLCFGGVTGAINITPGAGTSPYAYSWSGTGVAITAEDQTGLGAGNYSVTVSDFKGCVSAPLSVTITQPVAALGATETHVNVLCFGNTTGSIDLTVAGGTSPYTYVWSNAATTQDLSGLAAGTYSVTVTDANGCTATLNNIIITQPASSITITSISSNSPICPGNTLNLSSTASGGTGILSYSWTGPNGFISSSPTPSIPNVTNAATGTYFLTVTDANGCTATNSTSVTINTSITITLNPSTNTICANNQAAIFNSDATGSPTPTVQWQVSTDNGTTWTNISGATGKSYTFTPGNPDNGELFRAAYTNVCGTVYTQTALLSVGGGVNFPKDLVSTAGCTAGTATLSTKITGGVGLNGTLTFWWERSPDNLNWSTIPGTIETHSNTGTYTPSYTPQANEMNYYFRLAVSNNGCVTYTVASLAIVNDPATMNQPSDVAVCNGKAVNVTFSGTNITSYNWTNDNTAIGLAASGTGSSISFTATNLTANAIIAHITVTPINGANNISCPGVPKTFTITVNPTPALPTVATVNYCVGSTAVPLTASASSGNTLLWYTVSSAGTGSTTAPTPSTATAGTTTYYVSQVSTAGCEGPRAPLNVIVNPLPTATIIGTTSVCKNGPSPLITFTGANGTAPYTIVYRINGGAPLTVTASNSVTVSVPTGTTGIFTYALVSVSDSKGCSQNQSGTAVITVNALPTVTVTPVSKTACAGSPTVLTASGANTYTWNPSTGLSATTGSTVTASPNTTQTYTVTGTDVNGCINTATTVITVNTVDAGAVGSDQTLCFGGDPAAFTNITSASGSGTITYQWQSSPTESNPWTDISGATAATLDIAVITQNMYYRRVAYSTLGGVTCSAIAPDIEILISPVLPGTIAANQFVCPGGDPLAFTSTVDPSTTDNKVTFTYQWQYSTDGGITWINITGATGLTYDAPGGLATTTQYRRVATGARTTGRPTNRYTCVVNSNVVTVTVNSLPVVSTVNSCIGGGTVTFTQTAGAPSGTWTINGGGTINASTGVFTPTTAGCFTATYTTPAPGCADTKSFVVYPAAPVLLAPTNTCNAAFTLPTVTPVTGFNVEYSVDNGSWSSSPTISTTPGCHSIQARYVLLAACGSTAANTPSTCLSNIVSVVIFPAAPPAPTVSSGCGAFTVTAPPAISEFTVQYSFDNGVTWGTNTPPTADNCTGYQIKTRYVTAADCGGTSAGIAGTGACGESPVTTRKVDNTKPVMICPTVNPVCVVPSNTYTIPLLITSDNCSANSALTITYSITGATTRPGTGIDASGIFNLGISTITWTVKDECGNSNTCTTQVTINPKPTPIITHN